LIRGFLNLFVTACLHHVVAMQDGAGTTVIQQNRKRLLSILPLLLLLAAFGFNIVYCSTEFSSGETAALLCYASVLSHLFARKAARLSLPEDAMQLPWGKRCSFPNKAPP
jgi:hypothetical protein